MRPAPLLGTALGVLALAASTAIEMPPRLVYNGSASAPPGFYRIDSGPIRRGDYVLARVPKRVWILVEERGYLPAGVPLIKRIAGLEGDRICRQGAFVLVNNVLAAIARPVDSDRRPLPDWQGCETLGTGRVFLLQDHPLSFDGRYLGPVDRGSILGRATRLRFFERKSAPIGSSHIQ